MSELREVHCCRPMSTAVIGGRGVACATNPRIGDIRKPGSQQTTLQHSVGTAA